MSGWKLSAKGWEVGRPPLPLYRGEGASGRVLFFVLFSGGWRKRRLKMGNDMRNPEKYWRKHTAKIGLDLELTQMHWIYTLSAGYVWWISFSLSLQCHDFFLSNEMRQWLRILYVKRISAESEGQVVTESMDTFPISHGESTICRCTPLKTNMQA